MGIPYSKQISAAFEEVTPLVAEGFHVLQTTRNITFLLAEIQVLTVAVLCGILLVLGMLLITCNPDLERERHAVVTPVVRWAVGWVLGREGELRIGLLVVVAMVLGAVVGYGHYWVYLREERQREEQGGEQQFDGMPVEEGRDVQKIKEGKAVQ